MVFMPDPTVWISIVGCFIALLGIAVILLFVQRLSLQCRWLSRTSTPYPQTSNGIRPPSVFLYREELLDSYTEQALWSCAVCQFQNHPQRIACDLCQTARGFDLLGAWKRLCYSRSNKKKSNAKLATIEDPQSLSITSIESCVKPPSNAKSLPLTEISGEKAVMKQEKCVNQISLPLNKLQLAARRRQMWKRLPIADGLHRWVRESNLSKSIIAKRESIVSIESEGQNSQFDRQSTVSVGYIRVRDAHGRLVLNNSESVATDFHYRINVIGESGTSEHVMNLDRIHHLPFPYKIRWFSTELHRLWLPWESGHVRIVVRRNRVFKDSFAILKELKLYQLRQRWRVEFVGEPALDAGGVLREWFTLLLAEMFDIKRGLFTFTSGEEPHYWINTYARELYDEVEYFKLFRFAGMVLGKAILEEQILPMHLALPFLKHILGVPISFSDLQFLDDHIYKSALMIREMEDVEALALDFTVMRSLDFKEYLVEKSEVMTKIHPLIENGSEKEVTKENREEYLDLLFNYYMLDSIAEPLLAFLTALYDVVPEGLLKVFDYQELELLMCGVPCLDLKDWKKHSDYRFRRPNHPTTRERQNCEWFWDILEKDLTNEECVRFLQFTTGTSRVPAQGFKGLISADGRVRRFTIMFVSCRSGFEYPRAHTCFNRLDLPVYKSRARMLEYLKAIVQMDITGFTIE